MTLLPRVAPRPVFALLLFCRPGFESECAAEITARAAALQIHGHCRTKPQAGYVLFQPSGDTDAARLHRELAFDTLIFARQWFVSLALLRNLPENDRATPLLEALSALPAPAGELYIASPDSEDGRTLSRLARGLARPLGRGLHSRGLLARAGGALRAEVCLLSGSAAYAGFAAPANSAPWPGGIPRLRAPRSAPSRSTLKLDEAFMRFLSPAERDRFVRPGMEAVDLGAAPGGWTWQLVQRQLHVTAVDNGPMDARLLESGLVTHLREDGFRYRPERAVDWLVCDIVDRPMRVAERMAQWLGHGWCRHAVFNLKLPMRRRYEETLRCLEQLHAGAAQAGAELHLACKQLYHDREEVTVYARRLGAPARARPLH